MNNGKAYAVALLDLSKEYNIDINQIVNELQLVNSYFDEEFISFLKNPKVSKDNKKDVFNKAFTNIDKNVLATLMVLIDNNKIVYLNEVIESLNELIDLQKGIIKIETVSTKPLSDTEKNAIKIYFNKKLGKSINLIETIDEQLVGGLIIKYQGKIIDGSLLTKQESLKEYLKK